MQDSSSFIAIVLAAGQGTRMKSKLPKVLHPLLGRPMLAYPVQAALDAGARDVVAVVGHGRAEVEAELTRRFGARVRTAHQPAQLGTGDAARCGADAAPDHQGLFLIFYGDAALIGARPLRALLERAEGMPGPLALLTAEVPDATGYGRILRDEQGRVIGIREQKDCSPEEARIREFNPGVYAVKAPFFREAVAQLSTKNAQRELLLTDVVAIAAQRGGASGLSWDAAELEGINDRFELALRERALRLELGQRHARAGVTLRDPETAFIDADAVLGEDVVIEPNVHLRGACNIGRGARIDTGCVLHDVTVREEALVQPYTVATRSVIGERAQVGPFSHLRPDSELGPEAHVGNFVETKKTKLGRGSKANHLAYLGDSVIGEKVNVGAGTIFCNYDGFMKHVTVLEDGVFVGSDSQMVAPVTVGKDAYIATGTTVTQDVPPGALAIGRARQENKDGLGIRLRERLKARADKQKAGNK